MTPDEIKAAAKAAVAEERERLRAELLAELQAERKRDEERAALEEGLAEALGQADEPEEPAEEPLQAEEAPPPASGAREGGSDRYSSLPSAERLRPGRRFGEWTVLALQPKRASGSNRDWLIPVRCSCPAAKDRGPDWIHSRNLLLGRSKGCKSCANTRRGQHAANTRSEGGQRRKSVVPRNTGQRVGDKICAPWHPTADKVGDVIHNRRVLRRAGTQKHGGPKVEVLCLGCGAQSTVGFAAWKNGGCPICASRLSMSGREDDLRRQIRERHQLCLQALAEAFLRKRPGTWSSKAIQQALDLTEWKRISGQGKLPDPREIGNALSLGAKEPQLAAAEGLKITTQTAAKPFGFVIELLPAPETKAATTVATVSSPAAPMSSPAAPRVRKPYPDCCPSHRSGVRKEFACDQAYAGQHSGGDA